jgi:hypothetical protein
LAESSAPRASGSAIRGVQAVRVGGRRRKETLWIVTESDRSVTTFLLPDEY